MTSIPSNSITISDKHVPFSAYQAIYYKLTKKTDKLRRLYKENYIVRIDDFLIIDQRIKQIIEQYKLIGYNSAVTHSTKRGYSQKFSSMEKFKLNNFISKEQTVYLLYEFDFSVYLPNTTEEYNTDDIAQRFNINILFEKIELEDDDVPYFMRYYSGSAQLRMSIEYSDYSVAQNLEAIINNWVDGLEKQENSIVTLMLFKYEGFMRNYADTLSASMPLMGCGVYIFKKNIIDHVTMALIPLSFYTALLVYTFVGYFVGYFYMHLRGSACKTEILITRGDELDHSKKIKIRRNVKSSISYFVFTILVGIFISLFSSYIYAYILRNLGF